MTDDLRVALTQAFQYAETYSITIPAQVMVQARRLGVGLKAAPASYSDVRGTYWAAIYDSVQGYLESQSPVTVYRNQARKAVADAFTQAGDIGYVDGGGELPLDEDTLLWLSAVQEAELGYVDAMFQALKEMRGQEDTDPINEAFARAERWSASLDGVYNQAKLYGAKNKMLEWELGDTEVHCSTCAKLNGQRHKASWYIAHNYIPSRPGSSTECGGYRCDCRLKDDAGETFSI